MADNFLPISVPHGGLIWQEGTNFGSKSGPGGPILAAFSAKISPAGPILGGTDFDYDYDYDDYDYDCDTGLRLRACTPVQLHTYNQKLTILIIITLNKLTMKHKFKVIKIIVYS